jgi:hypothetical protein
VFEGKTQQRHALWPDSCMLDEMHELTLQYLWGNFWCKNILMELPPYSDLALCYFFLFATTKAWWKGMHFGLLEEGQQCTSHNWTALSEDGFLQKCFQVWQKRIAVCINRTTLVKYV